MSPHVHTAALCFEYPTAAAARLIERSVRVEVDQLDADRSTAGVSRTNTRVEVDIAADDLVALRAGLNSWLRYLSVAEQVAGCESTRHS
ncbi:KEOPS complex subunit Pcc1 [Halohasta litchfieldiae]|uniref:KEOPS complex subunit Pcc1 n=1 Tax=Halohasta litchfieldiae TaxID=1073996 RepID=A0A1H6SGG5_9EURY|nr:KEOPS complex subunit Pcc1 [Halohasta litchfieldiae]ATW87906.1 KEOPS complex subunit Pcc1 [Halohasta litchfieldiae]SEI62512.1 KEOPS complex subunit Pcc1 [Halohasta litchfieldiae]